MYVNTKKERVRPLDDIITRLVKVLVGIRENVKVAKACQRHGLQFASNEGAPMILIVVLQINKTTTSGVTMVVVITSNIFTTAFNNDITTLSLFFMFDGADTVHPVVLSVLGLEFFHESPVMVPVAPG